MVCLLFATLMTYWLKSLNLHLKASLLSRVIEFSNIFSLVVQKTPEKYTEKGFNLKQFPISILYIRSYT